jgi:squalene synthase HpnC
MSFYGYARLVDDLGDEATGDRTQLLDLIESDLDRTYAGLEPEIPAIRELATTIRACDIPADPFRRLIQANRQDQVISRYERFADLVGYCELSANPVGHLVLYAFGAATPERMALSDRICTALQLIEHWQDVVEDYARGRIYLPLDDLARFGCAESELAGPPISDAVLDLMAFETDRAATWLDDGAPLVSTLSGYARIATAGYVGGGRATIAAITESGYDVFRSVPRPRPRRVAREALRLLLVGS